MLGGCPTLSEDAPAGTKTDVTHPDENSDEDTSTPPIRELHERILVEGGTCLLCKKN